MTYFYTMYHCKKGVSSLGLWSSLFWDVTQCNVPVGRRPYLYHGGSLDSIWSWLIWFTHYGFSKRQHEVKQHEMSTYLEQVDTVKIIILSLRSLVQP